MSKTSIKSIAELMNLSPGTVSIVLNGRGDELRISKSTQERIMDAAKNLGYQPNVHARRLRQKTKDKPAAIIGVLWSTQYSSDVLVRFFDGIQHAILEDNVNIEVVYKPYPYSGIDRIADVFQTNPFNGVIVFGASDQDVEYVKSVTTSMPLVLFNRMNDRYSSVCVDDFKTGAKVAELFHARGHRDVGVVESTLELRHHAQRKYGFVSTCEALGLRIAPQHMLKGHYEAEGGRQVSEALVQCDSLPTALFFTLDSMVPGAFPVFERNGVRVPGDIEVVAYSDSAVNTMLRPSLTVVDLPVQQLVQEAIRLILQMIDGDMKRPVSVFGDTFFVFRESCGGFPEK